MAWIKLRRSDTAHDRETCHHVHRIRNGDPDRYRLTPAKPSRAEYCNECKARSRRGEGEIPMPALTNGGDIAFEAEPESVNG